MNQDRSPPAGVPSDPTEGMSRSGRSEGAVSRASSLAGVAAAALVAWVTVSVTVAVLSRYYYRQPLAWSIEVSEYALLFVTFLALAAVARSGEHITVTIINEDNAPRISRVLDVFHQVVGVALALVFFLASAYVTYDSFEAGVRMSRILPVDRWVILAVIPVGSFLLLLVHGRNLLDLLRRRPHEDDVSPPAAGGA